MIFSKSHRCSKCGKDATCKLWTKWFCQLHYEVVNELYHEQINEIIEEDRKAELEYLMLHNDNVEALK